VTTIDRYVQVVGAMSHIKIKISMQFIGEVPRFQVVLFCSDESSTQNLFSAFENYPGHTSPPRHFTGAVPLSSVRSIISNSCTTGRTASTVSTASFSDYFLALLAPTVEVVLPLILLEILHRRLLEVVVAQSDGVVAASTFCICFDDFSTHGCSGVEV
jgi:hypothetical protein